MRWTALAILILVVSPRAGAGEKKARVDRHGDALPAGALTRLGTVRLRHAGLASFVAFLPDGKTLVSAGRDQTIRLWDVRTGKERRRFDLADPGRLPEIPSYNRAAVLVSLSADGKRLAAVGAAGIRVWDTAR